MRPRRIYLPLTREQVQALAADRTLPALMRGYAPAAPTGVDARISPAAAEEESEYTAFMAAAGDPSGVEAGERRIVASADVPVSAVDEESAGPGVPIPVTMREELPVRQIVSIHLDEFARGEGSGAGDGDGSDEAEPDLLWFDITELDTILEELG